MALNIFLVYSMEHGQNGEGEVPEHFFFGASIEEIDSTTANQV